MHNSSGASDADGEQPEERTDEPYAVDPGDFALIYYSRDEYGDIVMNPSEKSSSFADGYFSEEELRKGARMKRIEADLDIVKAGL